MFSVRQLISKLWFSICTRSGDTRHPRDQRIAWIDEMILKAPNVLHRHRFQPSLDDFFFFYSTVNQEVVFRASMDLGGEYKYANDSQVIGRLREPDWTSFWPLILERLNYFNQVAKDKRFHGCIVHSADPGRENLAVNQALRTLVVVWNLKPCPEPIPDWSQLPNFEKTGTDSLRRSRGERSYLRRVQ